MKKCRKLVVLLLAIMVVFAFYPVKNAFAASDTVYRGVDYSAVYNKDYYLSHNPDLKAAFGNNSSALIEHFVTNGMKEGRQASDSFRLSFYKSNYSDLKAAFGDDNKAYYMHFINSGVKEGRLGESDTIYENVDYSKVYNPAYYYEHNADVAKALGYDTRALIKHFVTCGMNEGRVAKYDFDYYYYRARYADLRNVFGNNVSSYYKHYMNNGYKENRVGFCETSYKGVDYSAVYSYSYYYNNYTDLRYAYGDDWYRFIEHFVKNGMNEGRQASSQFSYSYYRNKYADLRAAFGDNKKLYYTHYMNNGKAENRKAAPELTGWQNIDGRYYYYNDMGEIRSWTGIDVSKHQGQIDWQAVKDDGIDFAIIRVGYGDNDASQDDICAEYNINECEKLGIPYGVYLYSYATTDANLESEIAHVLRLVEGRNPEMGVYLDMEDDCMPKDPTVLNAWAYVYLKRITEAGYTAGIYANSYWFNTYLTDGKLDDYDKWVAEWNIEGCSYKKEYKMWQYTSNGEVEGINGRVDMNAWLLD